MPGWNFADVWELIADLLPDAPALIQEDRRVTWADFDRRADGLAAALAAAGASPGDKVAQYLYNCPEYLESTFAAYKASFVPVNTNYRYGVDELAYLWDNADAVAVVFHGTFASRVDEVRGRVPSVATWLWVDDGTGPCPPFATPYEAAASRSAGRFEPTRPRDGDDLTFIYTGGTTGLPKGVMWRQDDLFAVLNATAARRYGQEADLDRVRELVTDPGPVFLPACPLMHGTGSLNAIANLASGGSVVTLPGRRFDVVELLDTIEREGVKSIAIVGDAFARPMLQALDREPDRWDLSSLRVVISSGVMFGEPVKQGLIHHLPRALVVDSFGSSEALGIGASVSSSDSTAATARFALGPSTRVVGDDGRDVVPGSGTVGRVAVRGRTPVGYYGDPDKSATTFVVIDGERWAFPGDMATVEADGTLTLLGRGSVCINTGGEKVFPEEVEEALKEHPAVGDAVCVGIPDERFGDVVVAVVAPDAPGQPIDEDAVVAHVKSRLAGYKAPKRILVVDDLGRAPNGKVDYARWRRYAADALAVP